MYCDVFCSLKGLMLATKDPQVLDAVEEEALSLSSKMVKGRLYVRDRLYVCGTILRYKRLGVNTKEEVVWYCGKRLAYIYKDKVKKNDSHYRCIWGKVARPHGNIGVVRTKFKLDLPPKAMGSKVRVFLYPSNM